jgi:hypothetical protein
LTYITRSFPLRLKAISIASNIQTKPDYRTFLELGSKLETYIDDLPEHIKFGEALTTDPGRLVGHMILDRYIRRALACVYRPFALGAGDDEIFLEGRRACIRTSLTLLNQQDIWDPDVADLRTINSRVYWDAYYNICRADIMQAALTVCLEIKALSEASSNEAGNMRPSMHSQLVWHNPPTMQWTKASLTRTVENTLKCLLRRLDDSGTDLRDALALSMALQSARLAGDQKTTDSLMVAGATTVIKACRQHFYGSENAINEGGKQQDVVRLPLQQPVYQISPEHRIYLQFPCQLRLFL